MEEEEFILDIQPPSLDDVTQEALIISLEGKVPNRTIIFKKLSIQNQPTFPELTEGIIWETPWSHHIPSEESLNKLLDWSKTQSSTVKQLLYHFLEDPEERLESTLEKLKVYGLIKSSKIYSPQNSLTIREFILRNLPGDFQSLVRAIKNFSPETKRPDATLRQFLRRELKTKRVIEVDSIYHDTNNRGK